ncbi:hypothetical protein ASE01_02650 [Nocardioides sp. Root190]|uniref:hypothetical protein n=1 Tax=Nocardioides sp. Root190 TaxID=1736488 RepID=UPI0006FA719F|nr:hypothetical protein [Nocardioides sp. Root190]KRB80391.1 hypothetical protein ASE01_02650 [Nocardioides sp. Root190]
MFLTGSDDDDVVSYIGSTIQGTLRDPSYLAAHAAPVGRFRLGLIDPDCVLLVDCGTAEVRVGRRSEPGVTGVVAMAGETALAACRGQVDLRAAVASGQIVVDGAGEVLLDLFAERRLANVG